MKWYFAARMRQREFIEKIVHSLEAKDHSIVYDWSKFGSLKPYHENSSKSSSVAREISEALKNVDVFVLLADESGTDMYVELGIAIGRWLDNPKTRIYAVGEFNNRSLMHFHPAIQRLEKLSDVFARECPDLLVTGDTTLLP